MSIFIHKTLRSFILGFFCFQVFLPQQRLEANPEVLLSFPYTSANTVAPQLWGLNIHPTDPFQFQFFIDHGHMNYQDSAFQEESLKFMHYFLAALSVPEDEMWVNLSPYEKNRIIPDSLSRTVMGQDLLMQDYFLKQITAASLSPEHPSGELFWQKLYEKTNAQQGSLDIPLEAFNKIWIVPDYAEVYVQDQNAFIIDARLKVLLEEDYLALNQKSLNIAQLNEGDGSASTRLMYETIIPFIEKEVNEGSTFTKLRQMYHAMILATWYKQNLKSSVLGQSFVNKRKLQQDFETTQHIDDVYTQYITLFRDGLTNMIREEYDHVSQRLVSKKYLTGGFGGNHLKKVLTTPMTPKVKSRIQSLKGRIAKVALSLIVAAGLTGGGLTSSAQAIEPTQTEKYEMLSSYNRARSRAQRQTLSNKRYNFQTKKYMLNLGSNEEKKSVIHLHSINWTENISEELKMELAEIRRIYKRLFITQTPREFEGTLNELKKISKSQDMKDYRAVFNQHVADLKEQIQERNPSYMFYFPDKSKCPGFRTFRIRGNTFSQVWTRENGKFFKFFGGVTANEFDSYGIYYDSISFCECVG